MDFKRSLGLAGIIVGMQSCLCIEYQNKTRAPPLLDIDGDGKVDAVYCHTSSKFPPIIYKVYFKRNLGEGKFAEPQLLIDSNTKPTGYCD